MSNNNKYVLMTAARNEAAYIEATIQSVVKQSILPERWAIVSDGSTDDTDRLIQSYEQRHAFISYLRKEKKEEQLDFGSKVFALRLGCAEVAGCDYNFIGNLDADITFEETYFERLLSEFKNEKLGVTGGLLYEMQNGQWRPRPLSETRYVPGAVQLFRRACYERVGGYVPSRWGGEDTIAVTTARMHGWETRSVPGIPAYHHKISEATRGYLKERFRSGVMFYAMGSHPLFELLKCMLQLAQKPYIIGGLARLYGYAWAAFTMKDRPVSAEFIRYFRQEQRVRVLSSTNSTY